MDDWNDLPTPDEPKRRKPGDDDFDLDAFLDSIDNPPPPSESDAPTPPPRRSGRARQRLEKRRPDGAEPPPAPIPSPRPQEDVPARRADPTEPLPPAATPRPPDIEAFAPLTDPSKAGERRRERPPMIGQRGETRPLTVAKRPSQVAAPRPTAGGFSLPNVDLRGMGRWLYVAVAVVIFVGVMVALALFTNEPPVSYPNAIWVGTEWSYTQRESIEVDGLINRLKQNRIGTSYPYVSYLKGDNVWAGRSAGENVFAEVEDNVGAFVGQYRLAYPEGRIIGWLGIPNDLNVAPGEPYRINDPAVRAEIASMSARLVNDLGFDGVILNVEPMPERDSAAFISLLQEVRRAMGDEGVLAVTMFADIAPSDLTVPRNQRAAETNAIAEYSRDFKQRVALLTDEIMVMAYNSSLTNPADYVEWVAYQTQSYAEAVSDLEAGAGVWIGIPTYDDQGEIHLAAVENIPTAVEGVLRGIQRAGEEAAPIIEGVAIYAEWTTSEDEWRLFQQFWPLDG